MIALSIPGVRRWPWELVDYEWDERSGGATFVYTNNETGEHKLQKRYQGKYHMPASGVR